MRRGALVRRHAVETLEVRTLLAADLSLDWPALLEAEAEPSPPAELVFGATSTAKSGETFSLTAESSEGNSMNFWPAISAEVISAFNSPVYAVNGTYSFDGIVYTIGSAVDTYYDGPYYDGPAVAHEWNSATGEVRTITLQSLPKTFELAEPWRGRAFSMAKIADEIVFVGRDEGLRSTVWDVDGNPTQAALNAESPRGHINDITSSGIMTGQQGSHPVAWTPAGEAISLPRTEITDILNYYSLGMAISEDGRYIVGAIGGGAVWEAVGDPIDGNYELLHYGYDDVFTYTMGLSDDGFAPVGGQFVLDTDAFGPLMFANYLTSEGEKNGVWSIEDGSFIRGFGFGRVQDVFVDAVGNIIVATNDNVSEMSGALWNFTESDPVYLKDLPLGQGFSSPYFTVGGLFELGDGFGGLLKLEQSGSSTHLFVEFALQDSSSGFAGELEFHFGGDSAQVGSVNPLAVEEMPIYHEWQEAVGQVWFTIGEDLPPGLMDLSWQLTAHAGSWLADPEGLDSLGQSFQWDVQVVDSADGDPNEIATFTLQGLDLSGYEVGDRVAIATIAYRPNPNNPVGIPSNVSGAYAEPTSDHGISLTNAVVNGGQELSIQAEVAGQFVPVIYDTDDSGRVGLSDFVQFISHYGQIPGAESPGAYRFDFNRDGRVGLSDFVLFIQHYGASQSSGRAIVMPGFEDPTPPPIMEAEPLSTSEPEQAVPSESGLLEGEPLRGQGLAWEMGYVGYPVDKSDLSPSRVASADVVLNRVLVSRKLDERLVDAVLEREQWSEFLAGNEYESEFLDFDWLLHECQGV